jgi:hypothetical protein
MAGISVDLDRLYQRQFGRKPVVPEGQDTPPDAPFVIQGQNPVSLSETGRALTAQDWMGREIWLPVKFKQLDRDKFASGELFLPYTVISISSKKTIIKTPLAERMGSVKELYSIDDYSISIKGFLIGYDKSGKYPVWPEEQIQQLEQLYSLNEAVELENALTDLFIGEGRNVVIESLEFPEVEGGRKHVRPFSMKLESDTIFELTIR